MKPAIGIRHNIKVPGFNWVQIKVMLAVYGNFERFVVLHKFFKTLYKSTP